MFLVYERRIFSTPPQIFSSFLSDPWCWEILQLQHLVKGWRMQVEEDTDHTVHAALYLLQVQLQPHISDRAEASWLSETPEPLLQEICRWARYALFYDPLNYVVWDRLACAHPPFYAPNPVLSLPDWA